MAGSLWKGLGLCGLLAGLLAGGLGRSATASAGQDPRLEATPTFPPAPIRSQPTPTKPMPFASLSDLAWLQGQWTGTWGPRAVTEMWSAPRAGTMLGTLQVVEDDKTTDAEFFMINQKTDGVEYRVLHFTTSFESWAPAVLSLMTADAKKFVFHNAKDGEPLEIVLLRTDADTYTSHWDIVPQRGESRTYDIVFKRQKPSAGSAEHR